MPRMVFTLKGKTKMDENKVKIMFTEEKHPVLKLKIALLLPSFLMKYFGGE